MGLAAYEGINCPGPGFPTQFYSCMFTNIPVVFLCHFESQGKGADLLKNLLKTDQQKKTTSHNLQNPNPFRGRRWSITKQETSHRNFKGGGGGSDPAPPNPSCCYPAAPVQNYSKIDHMKSCKLFVKYCYQTIPQ